MKKTLELKYVIIFIAMILFVNASAIIAMILFTNASAIHADNSMEIKTPERKRPECAAHYKDREEFESFLCGESTKNWWDLEFGGTTFYVCLEELPSLGNAHRHVYVLRKRSMDNHLGLVWFFYSFSAGPIEVIVDKSEGTVSVIPIANNKLQGSVIGFFNLAAVR